MLTVEETIKSVIDRTKGIIEVAKSKKAYKEAGISVDDNGNVFIEKRADDALKSLITNIANEGGVIAKITLNNLAQEKGLSFNF